MAQEGLTYPRNQHLLGKYVVTWRVASLPLELDLA
jgi:hypothetical protein